MSFPRILVGWDGSESADAALRVAVSHAQEFGGDVEALVVFAKPGTSAENGRQAPDPERREVLEKFAALFETGPVRLRAVVEATSPARVLARVARDHGFDLIAIGRHSTGRDGDATLHELAAHSTVPLLVVGPEGAGDVGESVVSDR
ncbi:MAG: universal stress protein [Actinomycetota bacterium]|jgi:nucleotide-binding universal stress UspA family protein|nr:universal stress protein [Actinomycetota bacterium]